MAITLFFRPLDAYAAHDEASPISIEQTGDRGLFGYHEIINKGTAAFKKWSKAIRAQAMAKATEKTSEWKGFIESLRDKSAEEQVESINHFMNKVSYISDEDNYGTGDYWATVEEFMARGGDCEDYALAKYRSLLMLGFKASDLRIVILFDINKGINHAVLAVALNGAWKILDNQSQEVRDDKDISNYKPIYAISKSNWWRFI